jgi:hypothetical protein
MRSARLAAEDGRRQATEESSTMDPNFYQRTGNYALDLRHNKFSVKGRVKAIHVTFNFVKV